MPAFRTIHRRSLLSATWLSPFGGKFQQATPAISNSAESADAQTLRVLTWRRPVVGFDRALETIMFSWADALGVDLQLDWVAPDLLATAITAEIQTGAGHHLIDAPVPLPQFQATMLDLSNDLLGLESSFGTPVSACSQSTWNPLTNHRWGIVYGWEPMCAIYRGSLWLEAGFPQGPVTTDDVQGGGQWIWNNRGVQMAIGLTCTPETERTMQSLVWATGGSVQNENESVVLASGNGTEDALRLVRNLFNQASTPVVLEWKADDQTTFMANGFGSYTLGGVRSVRSIVQRNPQVAADTLVAAPPAGPGGLRTGQSTTLSMPTMMVPSWNRQPSLALALVRHVIAHSQTWCNASTFIYLPAFPNTFPTLMAPDGALAHDPFDTASPSRLAVLAQAPSWTVSSGWPGPLNPMINAGHDAGILTTMMASAATMEQTDSSALDEASAAFATLAKPWRTIGLMQQEIPATVG